MRRMIRTTGIAAAGFVLAVGVAGAADRYDQQPESHVYLNFAFGGARLAPRGLHFGLRIDQDVHFVEGQAKPLMQFDYTLRGLSDARVNGVSVLSRQYRLHQSEEQAAEEAGAETPAEEAPAEEAPAEEATAEEAPAEEATTEEAAAEEVTEEAAAEGAAEEGFFSGMWSGVTGFFGGLFGDDEEEVAEEAGEAPAETAEAEAPPEDLAEGTFMSYNMVDWGLLALGVAGVGLAASEVAGGDETQDLVDSDGDGIADNPDGTPAGGCPDGETVNPVPDPLDEFPDCIPIGPFAGAHVVNFEKVDPAYQAWLDSGTGHMGDLGD